MLREIDGVAVFMSYEGTQPTNDEREEMIFEDTMEYTARWDDELQPALGEVQLLATPHVADLADRMSGALLEFDFVGYAEGCFNQYDPTWFQTQDVLQVLRDAMRVELGLNEMEAAKFPRSGDWPWLPDRPERESYIQDHAADTQEAHSKHHLSSSARRTTVANPCPNGGVSDLYGWAAKVERGAPNARPWAHKTASRRCPDSSGRRSAADRPGPLIRRFAYTY